MNKVLKSSSLRISRTHQLQLFEFCILSLKHFKDLRSEIDMSYLYTSYSAHKETELSVEVSQRDINYSIQFRKYNLNSVDSNC